MEVREPGGGSNKKAKPNTVTQSHHWLPYSQATPTAPTNLKTGGFFYGMGQQREGISLPWRAEAGVILREDKLFKTELPWGLIMSASLNSTCHSPSLRDNCRVWGVRTWRSPKCRRRLAPPLIPGSRCHQYNFEVSG